jgi:glutathione S-transferase
MLEELGVPYHLHEEYLPGSRRARSFHPCAKVPILLEYNTNTNNSMALPTATEVPPASSTTITTPLPSHPPDFSLYESVAINTYLGEACDSFLVPRDPHQRARYHQVCLYILCELDAQALWMQTKHERLGHVYGHLPEMVAQARTHFAQHNALIVQEYLLPTNDDNSHLYLLGKDFTAADIVYGHCLDWALSAGWKESIHDNPTLMAYRARYQERPAYQRARAMRQASQTIMLTREKAKQHQQTAAKAGSDTASSSSTPSSKM